MFTDQEIKIKSFQLCAAGKSFKSAEFFYNFFYTKCLYLFLIDIYLCYFSLMNALNKASSLVVIGSGTKVMYKI